MKTIILFLGILVSFNVQAQFNGCCPGFGGGDWGDFHDNLLQDALDNASNEPMLVKCTNQQAKLSFVRSERMDVYDHLAGNGEILDAKFTSGVFKLDLGNLRSSFGYQYKYPGLKFNGGYYSKKISKECSLDLFYPGEFLKHIASGAQNKMEGWIVCDGQKRVETLTCSFKPAKN